MEITGPSSSFPFRPTQRTESVEAELAHASLVGIDAAWRLPSLGLVASSTNSSIPTIVDTCPAIGTKARRSQGGDGPSGMSPRCPAFGLRTPIAQFNAAVEEDEPIPHVE